MLSSISNEPCISDAIHMDTYMASRWLSSLSISAYHLDAYAMISVFISLYLSLIITQSGLVGEAVRLSPGYTIMQIDAAVP